MKIELELWQVISLMLTIVGAFAGIGKLLLANVTDQIKQLAAMEAKRGDDVLKLERELSTLRLEMMRDFTRREDHNQAIASIRISLDNMSLRIEKALSTGARFDA